VEQGDDQFARLEVPEPDGLILASRDHQPAVGRGRYRPDVGLVSNEVAKLCAAQVVGNENTTVSA
jgi:hypothetical protein